MPDGKTYVTEKKVTELTGIPSSTLRKQRFYRYGIPYSKIGRSVRYLVDDVYRYMEAHRIAPGQQG